MAAGKWLQIGGKWYYFYADGKLAVNTTIEWYTVGEDGARKEN
jgi:glucan-binding YG repeat protein